MKQPQISRAPLAASSGGPSPALLRAAEAWREAERATQLAAVLKTAPCEPARFVLASTMDNDATKLPAGAVLAECLPGRAAVVMMPQVGEPQERCQLGTALLLGLDQILLEHQTLLAQALTIDRSDEGTRPFLNARYSIAGDLFYLAANLADPISPRAGLPPYPLDLVAHSPGDDERWIPLIEETYHKSLDCPAVDGLRPTRDVLAGYRDIGQPRKDWWFIARHDGRDVGCLILADHAPAKHAELVYMGLIPEVRGRGWGVYLAEQAKRIASQSSAEQLVLSVDAANLPAWRHYQAAGFRFWEQRTILIKSLAK
jgi:ribosomal protein S18 acetylase RimI-like enzyme